VQPSTSSTRSGAAECGAYACSKHSNARKAVEFYAGSEAAAFHANCRAACATWRHIVQYSQVRDGNCCCCCCCYRCGCCCHRPVSCGTGTISMQLWLLQPLQDSTWDAAAQKRLNWHLCLPASAVTKGTRTRCRCSLTVPLLEALSQAAPRSRQPLLCSGLVHLWDPQGHLPGPATPAAAVAAGT
jgi:hypothetical protein